MGMMRTDFFLGGFFGFGFGVKGEGIGRCKSMFPVRENCVRVRFASIAS